MLIQVEPIEGRQRHHDRVDRKQRHHLSRHRHVVCRRAIHAIRDFTSKNWANDRDSQYLAEGALDELVRSYEEREPGKVPADLGIVRAAGRLIVFSPHASKN